MTRTPFLTFCRTAVALTAIIAVAAPAGAQTSGLNLPAQPEVVQGPASVADLAEGLLGAVVNISTSQSRGGPAQPRSGRPAPTPRLPEGSPFQEFFDEFFNEERQGQPSPRGPQMQSLGSGFVVDAEQGIVITNNHVVADADQIEVNFPDGGTLQAELIGADRETDLAVLRVDPTLRELTAVELGDSDAIRIGDWVMAIGNPFGLGGSVSIGIVSARGRDINAGRYDDFIQTDAAINRGNSGGPLFDMYGRVIGINTAIISPSGGSIGIGFAIPSNLASNVVAQLREFGETRRGWLGVRIQPVTDEIAESLGMARAEGALIAGIVDGGPADTGVIQPGDVVTTFNGRRVRQMRDLPRIVAESPVGETVDVVIVRDGEEQTVQITLGRLEEGEAVAMAEETTPEPDADADAAPAEPSETASLLGLTVASLTDELRTEYGIVEDVSGLVITEVEPGSPAEDRGLLAGEVITEIGQEAVSSPDQAVSRVRTLREQGRRNIFLMVASPSGELKFLTLLAD